MIEDERITSMRVVFAGTPEFAVPSLEAVSRAHDVVGVITRHDAPLGRKRTLTPSPVAAKADELGFHLLKANTLGDQETSWAAEFRPDIGVIVAYGGLVREPLLSLPRLGWINLHFSDLPRWRGAAPVQRALMAGEQRLGVTVFRLAPALDAGAVLTRDYREFEPGTSAGSALTTLAEFGTTALLDAIDLLAVNPDAGEPQQGEPTYAHKLSRDDGKLDLSLSASAVLAHWAGVTPEPGAFVECDGQPLKLLEVGAGLDGSRDAAVGQVASVGQATLVSGRALLQLSGGSLELLRVQPSGKQGMRAADWLRGRGGSAQLT